MPTNLTAIHIRTGEPGPCRTVENWLEVHGVSTLPLADAYDACVHLVQHPADVPDLAFVGADWLTPEEWPIVRYLHDTWPGLGVIIYASRSLPGLPETAPLRTICTSVRTLRQLLEPAPEELLRTLRAAALEEPQTTRRTKTAARDGDRAPATIIGPSRAADATLPPEKPSAALAGDSRRRIDGSVLPDRVKNDELSLLDRPED